MRVELFSCVQDLASARKWQFTSSILSQQYWTYIFHSGWVRSIKGLHAPTQCCVSAACCHGAQLTPPQLQNLCDPSWWSQDDPYHSNLDPSSHHPCVWVDEDPLCWFTSAKKMERHQRAKKKALPVSPQCLDIRIRTAPALVELCCVIPKGLLWMSGIKWFHFMLAIILNRKKQKLIQYSQSEQFHAHNFRAQEQDISRLLDS